MEINKQRLLDEALRCLNLAKRFRAEENAVQFEYFKGNLVGIGKSFFYLGYPEEGNRCKIQAQVLGDSDTFKPIGKA